MKQSQANERIIFRKIHAALRDQSSHPVAGPLARHRRRPKVLFKTRDERFKDGTRRRPEVRPQIAWHHDQNFAARGAAPTLQVQEMGEALDRSRNEAVTPYRRTAGRAIRTIPVEIPTLRGYIGNVGFRDYSHECRQEPSAFARRGLHPFLVKDVGYCTRWRPALSAKSVPQGAGPHPFQLWRVRRAASGGAPDATGDCAYSPELPSRPQPTKEARQTAGEVQGNVKERWVSALTKRVR